MENFVFALNATMPVFLIIVLGKFLIKRGIITEKWTKVTDKFAFRVALPITLFLDIADMHMDPRSNLKLVIFCMLVTTIMFFLTWLLSYIFLKDKTMVGSFTQGSVRGSAAILGIPFAMNMYGRVGMVPLMILAVVPLFNAYSVIILAISSNFRNKKKDIKEVSDRDDLEDNHLSTLDKEQDEKAIKLSFGKVLKSIVKNPLIIGIALGFPFCIFKIKIPFIIHQSLCRVGDTATALMLISIGAGFEIKDLTAKFKHSFISTFIKLVILPLIFMPIAVSMGFRNDSLLAILIMLASPAAISAYVMSKSMNNDYVLMSNTIVMTTLFSAVTFTFWVFGLKCMNLI